MTMHGEARADAALPDGDEILFRILDAPVASWSGPGIRWAVEYWREEMAYPIAQAWVFMPYQPYIDWLHVMEEYRREGVGTALLAAIRERWPDVEFDAVTESGERLLASLGKDGGVDDDRRVS